MFLKRVFLLKLNKTNFQGIRNYSDVAFIGLGNMGSRMAANLAKKGKKLKIFDVTKVEMEGAKTCISHVEAATDSPVLITMLPNGSIVKETVEKLSKYLPKNALIIDCSTIEPRVAQELSKKLSENNIHFVDAPVSGGITGAEKATLTFMVGGDKNNFQRAEPILSLMGGKILHCGEVGAGQIAKLCNNLILGVTMIATAEGMNLGVKMGLDPKLLASIVNISSGRSWSSDTYNPVPGVIENVPSSNNYEGGFAVRLMAKDLGLAEDAALNSNSPVPLAAIAHQFYRTMIANGYGNMDFSSVYKFLKGTD